MMSHRVACVVILYHPDVDVLDNIKTYFPHVDYVYLWCNSVINDNFKNLISSAFDNDKIIWCGSGSNDGIGIALNRVFAIARSNKIRWMFTMDQDSSFASNAVKSIIDYSKSCTNNDIAIVAANHVINGRPVHQTADEKNWVMMSGNLVDVDVACSSGGFNEDFFIDGVDIEFCRRLISLGYGIHVCLDAFLNHKLGDTKEVRLLGRTITTTNHSAVRLYYIYRNYLYFNTKIACSKGVRRCLFKFLIHKLICVFLFENEKLRKLKMISIGVVDYLFGHVHGKYNGPK